jgi:hypothetical protein
MNDKLERILDAVILEESRHYPRICLEQLDKNQVKPLLGQ